ncbi:TPA: hypothetical protein JD203_03530 [Cronobacter sakazakii]|uniref:putative holin n=1 Tax=Cronobacter sakazakii TaxID=28141 RepID=UPI00097870D6|nr:putative holin [Cronobacter sakazakii]EIZ8816840.1 hypothetical protein [Cronobacter sakazakii]EJO9547598.1 hypothetical protein [Cronobacter sakazakii]EKF8821461.1 hypothetical protein [Cronobacter sakazakii]ELY4089580.1 hypothetical protein [Cronobacter sakazakii]ELY4224955.1 hypothetical protein [Cronobacter sakazakii]
MSVSLTSIGINQGLTLGAVGAYFAGVPPEVALGALAGAVIFITAATEYSIKRRVFLSLLSFFCGLLFYKPVASILIGLASLIPTITASSFEAGIVFSSGAFVAAIVAVRVGLWIYRRSDNPGQLIQGGKGDDKP